MLCQSKDVQNPRVFFSDSVERTLISRKATKSQTLALRWYFIGFSFVLSQTVLLRYFDCAESVIDS